ncbi:MAG: hypothetical protein IH585_19280 [Anaerolineaceae bacterium]|nr:hypothetical protein [Anaerolineaceae bacterium]
MSRDTGSIVETTGDDQAIQRRLFGDPNGADHTERIVCVSASIFINVTA